METERRLVAETCGTCDGSGVWESTTEESPTVLVNLGACPDCDSAGVS